MFIMNNLEELKECPNVKVNCCPHCKSTMIIKYGKYNNEQRYKCKDCCKTFSARTNTPWYHSKKTLEMWMNYYYLMLNLGTLRQCAFELKINLTTAFLWRHKILNSLEKDTYVNELMGPVHIQKRIIKENRKGQKGTAQIPQRKVWMHFSVDSNDGILGLPTCLNKWNKDNFKKIIYKKINKLSYIHTIGDRYVEEIAKEHNKALEKDIDEERVRVVLLVTKNISKLMIKYHGIASKYLRRYMAFAKILSMKVEFKIREIIENIFGKKVHKNINGIRKEAIVNI